MTGDRNADPPRPVFFTTIYKKRTLLSGYKE